jgi:hypothetical protein
VHQKGTNKRGCELSSVICEIRGSSFEFWDEAEISSRFQRLVPACLSTGGSTHHSCFRRQPQMPCRALVVSSVVIWRPMLKSLHWVLDVAGSALWAFTCFTIAWMPWNARFLCPSFILFGLSLAVLIFESPNDRSWKQITLGLINNLVCDLPTTALWTAKTSRFLERYLRSNGFEPQATAGNETGLQ